MFTVGNQIAPQVCCIPFLNNFPHTGQEQAASTLWREAGRIDAPWSRHLRVAVVRAEPDAQAYSLHERGKVFGEPLVLEHNVAARIFPSAALIKSRYSFHKAPVVSKVGALRREPTLLGMRMPSIFWPLRLGQASMCSQRHRKKEKTAKTVRYNIFFSLALQFRTGV